MRRGARPPTTALLAAWLLGALTARAGAQDAADAPATPADTEKARGSAATALYGAGFGSPLGPYFALGIVLGDVRFSGSLVGIGPGRGVLIQGEVGRGGGALSLGTPLPFLIKLPRRWEPFALPVIGLAPKATLLRTWGDPDGAPADQTYLGPGLELTALVHFRTALLWRVSGPEGERRLWTWGVGLGF